MAARLSPKHDQFTRDKIRTSQLVNRLQGFAMQEKDPTSGKPIVMTRDQITAAIALLKKALPDLTSTELKGEDGGPVQTSLTISFVKPT